MDDAVTELEALYRDLSPALLAYFRQQHTVAGAAEDLLQDTFVRAIRNFARLRASASPRAYLFGIARNVRLDALRSHRPTEELRSEPAAPATALEDARVEPMRAAISTLHALQRETLLLKLQHDLSYEEIAEVLGIPIGTVRSRLHHAVNQLRTTLSSAKTLP